MRFIKLRNLDYDRDVMQAFETFIVRAYYDLVFSLSNVSKRYNSVVEVTDKAYVQLLDFHNVTVINWHWYLHLTGFDLISDWAFHFEFQ